METKNHIANLPDGWSRGVRITSLRGLERYANRSFILGGKFMLWAELSSHSLNSVIQAMSSGQLYSAYNPADPKGTQLLTKIEEVKHVKYPHAWRGQDTYDRHAAEAALAAQEAQAAKRSEALPSGPGKSDL